MKRLIVNADDFGLTDGVNRGIAEGFRRGILTSATLMANGGAFAGAVAAANANPELGVGCHLVLIGGRAVADRRKIPLLADSEGRLPTDLPRLVAKLARGKEAGRQVREEFRAQVEKVRSAGIEPTHLDSHKHTHCHPRVMEALGQVAEESGILRVRRPFEQVADSLSRVQGSGAVLWKQRMAALASHGGRLAFERAVKKYRLKAPVRFYGVTLTGRLNPEAIRGILEGLPDGTSELMCHPGYPGPDLTATGTRLREERSQELKALLDPGVKEAVKQLGIRLVSYRELP
jgi:hopanoid biosynthesis associated protein HpnK